MAPPQPYQPAYLQPIPQEEQPWPIPRLHLRVTDILSPGCGIFFANVEIHSIFKDAVIHVLKHLYTPSTAPTKRVLFHVALIISLGFETAADQYLQRAIDNFDLEEYAGRRIYDRFGFGRRS